MLDLIRDTALQQALNHSILLWALVAARIAPIIQLVPYLGGMAIPALVKIGITIAVTAIVYPMIWSPEALAALPASAAALAALLLKELFVGAAIGFLAALVFDAVRIAGQIIDNVRGQTQATALVPQLPERVSVSADFLYQLHVVVFLLIGGHRLFLAALARSFVAIPPYAFPNVTQGALHALVLGGARFAADAIGLGVLIAFPVIAAILMTDLCLALINRAAPQINVFFLGMPLKALAGIAVLCITLHLILDRVVTEALDGIAFLEAFLQSLSV